MKVQAVEPEGAGMPVLNEASGENWIAYHGDSCEVMRGLPDESVGYSIFSPPFSSLYTYSNSDRDMGNCKNHTEFFAHFQFIVQQLFRVLMPGRCVSVHCMLLPTSKATHGEIGLYDFRGDLIREFRKAGFLFHSEATIFKDPVTAMTRTKALGLLWKQLRKDSCRSRMGVPDYVLNFVRGEIDPELPGDATTVLLRLAQELLPGSICTFRKDGDNPVPVSHTEAEFPVKEWQQYASPVWMDINPSETLQYMSARSEQDERHICPLQLGVIRRCLRMWSRPGDVVFTPFGGIGSEGYEAVLGGRRAVLCELKESYFKLLARNMKSAEEQSRAQRLF